MAGQGRRRGEEKGEKEWGPPLSSTFSGRWSGVG